MKIWRVRKSDTAIKWCELLAADEPPPLACVAHNVFVGTIWGAQAGLLIQDVLEYTTVSARNTGEVAHARFPLFP
jgi:hypothetical protein